MPPQWTNSLCAPHRPPHNAGMKKLLLTCIAFAALSLLAGCAQQKESAPADTGLLCNVCVMTGEAIDASSPTSAYNSGKVGFCCEKCQTKWNRLDDAARKQAFEAHKK